MRELEVQSCEVSVNETPNPQQNPQNPDPLIEDPQQTPPHVPELPPMRDPEPQKERTRR
jgi:hypothetical protein